MKFLLLIFKNLKRNVLSTLLASLGTIALVLVVTLIWSVLWFLDRATAEKSQNLKAIVTERWQIPSQMPFAYAESLSDAAYRNPGDIKPLDSMTWQFYGGTLDPVKRTRENLVFAFAMDPRKLTTMMDELDSLPVEQAAQLNTDIAKMREKRNGLIIGQERLKAINKLVGERITLYGLNYKDVNLEFEIVGLFPPGRYDQSACMNREYLNDALDEYPRSHKGQKHPMANKSLNLVWLRVPDMQAYAKVTDQIMNSPSYAAPAVKVETASSGIAAFLDAYRDLIWGMRWLLAPAILVTLSLVISNAISINVRARRKEMAVLKVLGFAPDQILILVLGEAVFIGTLAGAISAWGTYFVVNDLMGGLKFPIAFFPAFFIPVDALWWGPVIGAVTSFLGSVWPAVNAAAVKVNEVFSKIA